MMPMEYTQEQIDEWSEKAKKCPARLPGIFTGNYECSLIHLENDVDSNSHWFKSCWIDNCVPKYWGC